jgi:hypothetical protein
MFIFLKKIIACTILIGLSIFSLAPLAIVSAAEIKLNDPGFTTNSSDTTKQWALAKAKFIDAWQKGTGSAAVTIAVIDTGIDFSHADLQRITPLAGYDFIHKKEIPAKANSDDNGHGTVIAGIIGGTPNNGIGISGALWDVALMPIKALDELGEGNSNDIASAIIWATDRGANIINLSIGGIGFQHDSNLSDAITYAFRRNVVIVAAVGNDVLTTGANLDQEPVYPVCDDNGENMIIGVTATDYQDLKPEFANYGKSCIDVSAPGKRVLSTINYDPVSKQSAPSSYVFASGTSLAVPYVASLAGLLKALNPYATNRQIRDRILATADNIDNLNINQCLGTSCKGFLGAGRINAAKAVAEDIKTPLITEGEVVTREGTTTLYLISGGKRHVISPFVKLQRYSNTFIRTVSQTDLEGFPEGTYAFPNDGTLAKTPTDATVYFLEKGLKFPITGSIFTQRKFNFSSVATLSSEEMSSWLTDKLLPPSEGMLVKSRTNQTVYWVVGGALHPISYSFFIKRGLNIFPIFITSDAEIKSFTKGEAYLY